MTIQLLDFQREDVEKLRDVPHALVGSGMGTGKTYVGCALDEIRREQNNGSGKTLVVCPLSVVDVWRHHVDELLNVKVRTIDPRNRDAFLRVEADVYVVHWDALRLMPELQEVQWNHIIADECHRAQNKAAQQTRALKKLNANYRTAMSGTPITNTPDKLWSILNWLYPQDYSSYWRFYGKFVDFVVTPQGYRKIVGPKNEDILLERIRPFYVRHLKKEKCCAHHPNGVMSYLPEKYYTEVTVDLLPQQKRAYDEMRRGMLAWVGEHEDVPLVAPVVVAQLVRLQQFADAYATVLPNGTVSLSEPSAKLDALMDFIEDSGGQQIVVFSQFSQMIKLLAARLDKKKIRYGLLTGDTPEAIRKSNVERFQAGELQVFAGTIQAGGVGITLHTASTVAFLDRSWSPALNEQAEDRLHRFGQRNAVQIVDFVARGTVDLGRKQRIEQKREWIRKILGDKG